MFEIKRYQSSNKLEWDNFVKIAKNSTFLFHRDFMEYHSQKFVDASYLIYKKGKLEGIFPGNISNNIYYSHQGLTYGGLIFSSKLSSQDVLNIFELLNDELKSNGITKVIYKAVPYIYHKQPSQEDIYALFRIGAKKIGCHISSAIYQRNKIKFIESRKSGMRKATSSGVIIQKSDDYKSFWDILNSNLENKYGKLAVHSLEEVLYLKDKFPGNISLYVALKEEGVVAGTVLFATEECSHVQYISANEIGKNLGALDMLFDHLINIEYSNIEIFDFGQSTENNGYILNENLIFQKEGFGGRGIVYEVYEYII